MCDQKTYVNVPFLKENFTDEEIEILPRMSSWAISIWVKDNKKRVGFKVKRILDYGRAKFIESRLGMQVRIEQYCDPLKESPECILLTGLKS